MLQSLPLFQAAPICSEPTDSGLPVRPQPARALGGRRTWLVGARPEQRASLLSELRATRSGRCAGFFVSDDDGSGLVRSGDLVAVRVAEGFHLFQAEAQEPGPILALSDGDWGEVVRAAARRSAPRRTREAIYLRLCSTAPIGRDGAPGDGLLGRTLGMLRPTGERPSPQLLRRVVEDLADRLEEDTAVALRGVVGRTRARAIARIAAQPSHPPSMDLEQVLFAAYRAAQVDFALARLEAEARACQREWRHANTTLADLAQPVLPGFQRDVPPVDAIVDPGFAASACIAVPLEADDILDAREPATRFEPLGVRRTEEATLTALMASMSSDSMVPLLQACVDPNGEHVNVELNVLPEHEALLGQGLRSDQAAGQVLVAALRSGDVPALPPHAVVRAGVTTTFKLPLTGPAPRSIVVELTLDDQFRSFDLPIERRRDHPNRR